jgi:hypothetical protein
MTRRRFALRPAIAGKPIDPAQNDTARRTSLPWRKVAKVTWVSVARWPREVAPRTETERR